MLTSRLTLLDRCWICDRMFSPNLRRNDHHIIPRAYGGVDGPQVSLCADHHSTLHDIERRMWANRSHHDLLTHTTDWDIKLVWLASRAYNAHVLIQKDPN